MFTFTLKEFLVTDIVPTVCTDSQEKNNVNPQLSFQPK